MRQWFEIVKSVAVSLVLHLGVAALIVLSGIQWPSFRKPQPIVFAAVVDVTEVGAQQEAEAEAEAAAEQQRQEELERERQEQEEQEAAQRLEEERLMELERLREQQRQEREAQRRMQARQEREEREREEREREEERRRLEEQRQRELEEIRRQREEAERNRREQEERLRELAERRAQEEAERQAAEEAQRERDAAEQAAAAAARGTLEDKYRTEIRRAITNNWIRPTVADAGIRCDVRVFQIPGGEITNVRIVRPCNADETTRRSIINAVNRTGELPYRGYEDVFEREIVFTFTYDG